MYRTDGQNQTLTTTRILSMVPSGPLPVELPST